MPVLTNATRQKAVPANFVAWPYIDTLYDYVQYLAPGGTPTPIGTLPSNLLGVNIGIVGGGMAGLVAAYELLKVGAVPVIFEASDRLGGRACSQPFLDNGVPSTTDFAELGSMRFPPSGMTLFHYLNQFSIATDGQFPDPGKVLTTILYQNQAYTWQANTPAPGPFTQIATDWSNFMDTLTSPLYNAWAQAQQNGDYSQVIVIWQGMIDSYRNVSFYEAVRAGIPTWTDADVALFGALGVGSGGFGPLFQINFLELMRIVVNMWEDQQQLIPNGINSLAQAFYTTYVQTPTGPMSLEVLGAVNLGLEVSAITPANGQVTVSFKGPTPPVTLPAVILATTTRSMEVFGTTLGTAVTEPVKTAIRNIHLMDSSKLFVRTATKFWLNSTTIPTNIQTDELPRGVYCLDYPQTEHGIVLVSYVWGDDSSKLLPMSPKERLDVFKQSIAQASPEFAEALVPMNGDSDIIMIDWENEDYYYGAFKLQYPGQEPNIAAAYYQFLTATGPNDTGVYLAGDSVSWSGGWTEGALQTGINAACAAIAHVGGTLNPMSPFTQNPNMYSYGDGSMQAAAGGTYQSPLEKQLQN